MVTEDHHTLFHIEECARKAESPVFDIRGRNLSFSKAGAEREDTLPLCAIAMSIVDVHGRHKRAFSIDGTDFRCEKLRLSVILLRVVTGTGTSASSRHGSHDAAALISAVILVVENVDVVYIAYKCFEATLVLDLKSWS